MTANRFVGNTAWMMGSRILRLGAAFAVSVFTARYLGRELYGRLSYAISFVMLFSALGTLGLNDILVRELVNARDGRETGELLGSATALRLAGTLLMVLLVLPVAVLLGASAETLGLMLLVSLSYVFLHAAQNLERFYEARVQARYSSLAQVVAVLVSAGAVWAAIVTRRSVVCFAAIRALEAALLLAGLVVFFGRAGGVWRWRFRRQRAEALARDGWPLMLTGVFILVYMRIDQVMIRHYLDEDAVGVYAVAVRLSEAWYFVPSVLAASLFAAILAARREGPDVYRRRLQLLYEVMTWLGLGIAIPTTFLAPWVIALLYGKEYAPAAPVLAWYIWAGVFVFQGIARGKWIVAEGLQRYAMVFCGSACALNVVLNAVLIPSVGITGAAAATVISCACQTLLIPALFTPTRPSVTALCAAFLPLHLCRAGMPAWRALRRRTY
ncbi:MAG: flippase [Lentisphaeria bacterium]|nr:flippase [Lentisphaeria bacterium]